MRTYTMGDHIHIGGCMAADGVTWLPEYDCRPFVMEDDGTTFYVRDDHGPDALSFAVVTLTDPFFGPVLARGTSFANAADEYANPAPSEYVGDPTSDAPMPANPPDPTWGSTTTDTAAATVTDDNDPPPVITATPSPDTSNDGTHG